MPVKLRLARHGRKRYAYYHIVVADGRAPRDGRFIERIGMYNPNSNPAVIELDFDKALSWLQNGAQPTETVRAILSYKGVLMKRHLLDGVKKGAFDEAAAEAKFQAWMKEKESKVQAKRDKLAEMAKMSQKERLAAEKKVNEDRAQAIAKKNAKLAAGDAEDAETEEEVVEEAVETSAEVEASVEEVKEEVVAEEAPAEEVKEEVVAEVAPVEEAPAEEVSEETTEEEKPTE